MENMGPMARALERLRTKKLLNSGAMKGKYYSKWHAMLKYVVRSGISILYDHEILRKTI